MLVRRRTRPVGPDHRRWLATVSAAATADALAEGRRGHVGGAAPAGDGHAVLRAYLDRWRVEAGEFFDNVA